MEPIAPGEPGDFGEPDRLDTTPEPSSAARARAIVVGAVVAGAALLVGVTAVSGTLGQSAPVPGSVESPAPTPTRSTAISWPTPRQPTPSPARPPVFGSSGFLADLDVVIYARSSRAVFRIDTKAERVTRTPVASSEDEAPEHLLALRDRVLVLPMDASPGTQIVDGQPATEWDRTGDGDEQYLPGPSNRVWTIMLSENGRMTAKLTDASGKRVYETVRGPGYGYFKGDGSGGLLYEDVGGVYRAGSAGLRRVTTGAILASGPRGYVAIECTARFACSNFAYRPGPDEVESRRRLGPARPAQSGNGALSVDGRFAATFSWGETGMTVAVIDVTTGRRVGGWAMTEDSTGGEPSLLWLPDGRLLSLQNSRLAVFDPRTGETARTSLRLPPLRQLALRPPAG